MLLSQSLRVTRILWGSLLGAVGVYAALAVSGLLEAPRAPSSPVLFPAFGGLAVTLAVMSFILPANVYRQAVAGVKLAVIDEPASEVFAAQYRKASPTMKVFADPAAAVTKAAMCFQTPFILSLALSEAIAMFGLVLAVLGFGVMKAALFFAAGAALIIVRFPTAAKIIEPFEAAKGASLPREPG